MANPYNQYSHLARKRYEEEDDKALVCPTCNANKGFWIGPLPVNRLQPNESLVIGQAIPKLGDLDFPVYMCPRCHHIMVPTTDGSSVGRRAQLFNRLCDVVEDTKTEMEPSYQGLYSQHEAFQQAIDEEKTGK